MTRPPSPTPTTHTRNLADQTGITILTPRDRPQQKWRRVFVLALISTAALVGSGAERTAGAEPDPLAERLIRGGPGPGPGARTRLNEGVYIRGKSPMRLGFGLGFGFGFGAAGGGVSGGVAAWQHLLRARGGQGDADAIWAATRPKKRKKSKKKIKKKEDRQCNEPSIDTGGSIALDMSGNDEIVQEIKEGQKKRRKLEKSSRTYEEPEPTPPVDKSQEESTVSANTLKYKPIPDSWVNDGLGGVYNKEGFTGRTTGDKDKFRIFKIDVLKKLNKPSAGKTRLCPFDCECCYI